ncbi:MAG TPA: hypothetical protein VN181_11835 [Thermoanaerobaculia bacterium]|nr:hypothetical protein [Thermoanaerobaculia bacterium]
MRAFSWLLFLCALAAPAFCQPVLVEVLPPISLADAGQGATYETTVAPPRFDTDAARISIGFRSSFSANLAPADSSGAVSASYAAGAFNSGIVVQDRNGNVLARTKLEDFWSTNIAQVYDPRIVYDAKFDRWVMMAITPSTMRIAISQSGNPAGAWNRYSISIGSIDYSGLAVTRDYVVAVTDRNSFFDSRFILMPRATMYATAPGAQLAVTAYNTPEPAAPVATDDSTGAIYAAAGYDDLRLFEITPQGTITAGVFSLPLSYTDATVAPQQGSGGPPLDPGDSYIADAVVRNGQLYAIQSVAIQGNGASLHTALQWWKWPLGAASADGKVIEDPTGSEWYSYPSIAVNRRDDVLFAFTTFSPTTFPSFAYILRDAAGTQSAPSVLRAGEHRFLEERWGDYNTVVVDPANGIDFWAVGMYSETATQWASWWSRIQLDAPRRRAVRK